MKLNWSKFSLLQLYKIEDYFTFKADKNVAEKIVLAIIEAALYLEKHPELGTLEANLSNNKNEYRSLITNFYKIIYYLDKDAKLIQISDVFDTRQNPTKLKRNT